jgi:hypothetical protein
MEDSERGLMAMPHKTGYERVIHNVRFFLRDDAIAETKTRRWT